jgi:hypothetical protein
VQVSAQDGGIKVLGSQRRGGEVNRSNRTLIKELIAVTMSWAVNVSGDLVPLVAYPVDLDAHALVGLPVRGKRALLKGAFVATMKSGHVGIFRREGKARLPIEELRGSRPVDALLHAGEAQGVAARGGATFARVLPLEMENEADHAHPPVDQAPAAYGLRLASADELRDHLHLQQP